MITSSIAMSDWYPLPTIPSKMTWKETKLKWCHSIMQQEAGPQWLKLMNWQSLRKPFPRFCLWYGHVTRSGALPKNTHQGKEPEKRRQGRQSKKWTISIARWRGKSFSLTKALLHDSLRCSAEQRSYDQPKLRDSDTKDRKAGTRRLWQLTGFQ